MRTHLTDKRPTSRARIQTARKWCAEQLRSRGCDEPDGNAAAAPQRHHQILSVSSRVRAQERLAATAAVVDLQIRHDESATASTRRVALDTTLDSFRSAQWTTEQLQSDLLFRALGRNDDVELFDASHATDDAFHVHEHALEAEALCDVNTLSAAPLGAPLAYARRAFLAKPARVAACGGAMTRPGLGMALMAGLLPACSKSEATAPSDARPAAEGTAVSAAPSASAASRPERPHFAPLVNLGGTSAPAPEVAVGSGDASSRSGGFTARSQRGQAHRARFSIIVLPFGRLPR